MNYDVLRSSLRAKSDELQLLCGAQIESYIIYLKKLEAEKKKNSDGIWVIANTWFAKLSEDKAANLFISVANKGLYIDGDTVLIQTRGAEIVPEYTYNAYKNLVLLKYPETTFDWGLVYQGDTFNFGKQNGKIVYTHTFGEPFSTERTIIGAYGIIRNGSGEFIEIINKEDITKFRNIAKTKTIWDAWYDRMVLKSIIKRICHIAFKDVVKDIDNEDNENYDLSLVNIKDSMQREAAECQTLAELKEFYDKYINEAEDTNALIALCSKRKNEIKANQNVANS